MGHPVSTAPTTHHHIRHIHQPATPCPTPAAMAEALVTGLCPALPGPRPPALHGPCATAAAATRAATLTTPQAVPSPGPAHAAAHVAAPAVRLAHVAAAAASTPTPAVPIACDIQPASSNRCQHDWCEQTWACAAPQGGRLGCTTHAQQHDTSKDWATICCCLLLAAYASHPRRHPSATHHHGCSCQAAPCGSRRRGRPW